MRTLLSATAALLLASMPVAQATTYSITFENTVIGNNPNYTITDSFLYDRSQLSNPSALYGLSNFDVTVVSQYGTLQMNTVWSVDSSFDALGLGTSNSPNTPALMLIFSNGVYAGINHLDQAATNDEPLPFVINGQTNMIPGRSVLVPSIEQLYGINYSGYGMGNWPDAANVFQTISGSLLTSPVPGPAVGAGLPGLLIAVAGFIGWRRSRRARGQNGSALCRKQSGQNGSACVAKASALKLRLR